MRTPERRIHLPISLSHCLIVLVLTLCAITGASADTIVDYGGTNLVTANQNGVLPSPTTTGLKRTYPLNLANAITPASGYTGSAVYGAFETEASTGSAVNAGLQWANNAAGDRINSFATWSTGTLTLSGLVCIKQADFIALNNGNVRFDATSSMTANVFLLNNSGSLPKIVRFAVLNDGTWYLSSSSNNAAGTFSIANLATESFGVWSGPASTPFGAVPTTFTTAGSTLTNIQAVGIYFLSSRDNSGLAQCMLQSLTVSATSAPPSPVSATSSTVTASPASVVADAIAVSTVTVTLKDASNQAVTNKSVALTSSRGAVDTISAPSGVSDANGVVTFTVKSSTTGTATLSAAGDGVALNQTAAVTFTPTTAQLVYEQMKNGINCRADTSQLPVAEYLDQIKAAGFKSIRHFYNSGYPVTNPIYPPALISTALNKGLVVNLCMFVFTTNKTTYVNRWKEIATYYSTYPETLVFELFNEPQLSPGFTDKALVMDWINSAVAEIRAISPNRILLIGGPAFEEPEQLRDYVTPTYLTYNVGGITFANDPNVFGAIHHYDPGGYTLAKGVPNTLADFPNWQNSVTSGLDIAATWASTWNKRVVLTEWGAQNDAKQPADIQTYTQFFANACAARNLAWTYYTSAPKDANAAISALRWSIFTLEGRKWDVGLVYYLTGADVSGGPAVSSMALNGGQISFTVSGPFGRTYTIQTSPDLSSWTNAYSITGPVLPFTWTDPLAGTFPKRFYRTVVSP